MDDDLGETRQFSVPRLLGVVGIASACLAIFRAEGFEENLTTASAGAAMIGATIGMFANGYKGAAIGAVAGLSVLWGAVLCFVSVIAGRLWF